ncbi:hypothetical protein Tco_0725686 [Tanacetum coccineum]|uniref:Uncharacterized protein n=1 Tax=Tanacetum coccineum TaxID=301880 RepID=A0ABQ4YFS7_9ASTR
MKNIQCIRQFKIQIRCKGQEEKVNMREAVDAGLVVTESSGTKLDKQDTSSSSGNYTTQAVDADIGPVNDEEPFAELSTGKKPHNLCKLEDKKQIKSVKETSNEAKVKNNIDVIETINIELEHSVAKLLAANEQLHKENEHLKQTYKELYDSIKKTRIQNKDNSESLISQINQKSVENADLKAQIQEKVFANAALNNELRKLKGNTVDSKFAKASILGKPPLQPSRNHLVVRQPNAFTSERPRISRPRESAAAKPHQVNAPNYSRNSHKESYGSNDMVHAYFLEDARKMTQDKTRIPSHKDMASTRAHCTPNACTPKPRNIYRSSPVSKCSGGMSNGEPLVPFPLKIRKNNPRWNLEPPHKPGRQNGIGQRPVLHLETFGQNVQARSSSKRCLAIKRFIPRSLNVKSVGISSSPVHLKVKESYTGLRGKRKVLHTMAEENIPATETYKTRLKQILPLGCEHNESSQGKQEKIARDSLARTGWSMNGTGCAVCEHFIRDANAGDDNVETKPDPEEHIRPAPSLMTPGYISLGLVQISVSPTPYVPPSKKDYEILIFLLNFYFNHFFEEDLSPINVHSLKKINNDQDSECMFLTRLIYQSFLYMVQDIAGVLPTCNIDNEKYAFHSTKESMNSQWTKDHPLEQVIDNPTNPMQTRQQLATDPEMCMFALTVSTEEPKNSKEAMDDSA